MIKIYGHPISDNVRKVLWAAEELGLPYEVVHVDLFKGEHFGEAFRAINPLGRVPVLDDDGFRLFESIAIISYLAERYGDGRLLPRDVRRRAEVQQWLAYQGCHYGPALERPWRMKNVSPLLGEPWSEAELTSLREAATPWLARLDQALDGRTAVVGDTFSIADIALAEPTGLAEQGGIDLAPYPSIRGWMAALATRPAYQKSRPAAA